MKRSGKILTVVLVFIICAIALIGVKQLRTKSPSDPITALREQVGEPEYKKLDPNKPINRQARRVEIAGRKFEIPIVYLSGALDKGEKQDGINFGYVLPDFASKAEFKDRGEYQQAFNDRRMGHLLLEEAKLRPSFEGMLEWRRAGLAKEEFKGKTSDGLEIYDWYHDSPEGLYLYSTVFLMTNPNSKVVTDYIECKPQREKNFPTCKHKFIDKGLLYYSSYNRKKYFSDWISIKQGVIAFVDGFEIKQ